MKENNTSRNNGAAVLVTQIRISLEDLGRLTDDAAKSETIKKYLEFCARFHQYSFANQILILVQCPDATHVAGFQTWSKMGRSIKKGSSAIRILAPMIYKRKKETKKEEEDGDIIENMEEKEMVRFFRPVCVFDVSQTMGKPLPGPDIKITGNSHQKLIQPLINYIRKQGITTVFRKITGSALGYTGKNKPIVVDTTLSPNQQVETLLHEQGHQLLHMNPNNNDAQPLTREDEELEASAVAYVVCKHYGLITKNPNYLALWNADAKKIKNHMERITGAARKIIQGIERNN